MDPQLDPGFLAKMKETKKEMRRKEIRVLLIFTLIAIALVYCSTRHAFYLDELEALCREGALNACVTYIESHGDFWKW